MEAMAYVQCFFLEPIASGSGHITSVVVLLENRIITTAFLQKRKKMISKMSVILLFVLVSRKKASVDFPWKLKHAQIITELPPIWLLD